jgi:FkbM family methyltransferase
MDDLTWLDSVLDNAPEVLTALRSGSRHEIPPLRLRSGLSIYHLPEDPIEFMLYETFIEQVYTEDFFTPHPNDVILDFGANIGIFAFYLLVIAPGIQVHCFEAAAGTRARLLENIARNSLQESVTVHPYAVAGQSGPRILGRGRSSGESSFFIRQRRWNPEPSRPSGARRELVECVDLKGAVELSRAEHVDLVKIDVEGAEAEILEAADVTAMSRISKISLEYHNGLRAALL